MVLNWGRGVKRGKFESGFGLQRCLTSLPSRRHSKAAVRAPPIAILAAFVAVFAVALAIDPTVATWFHERGMDEALKSNYRWVARIARLPGNFVTYSLPIAGFLFLFVFIAGTRWLLPSAFILLCGILAGSNAFVKWIVGRTRPFQGDVYQLHPFVGGIHGLFGPNQSFPSGDVSLAAATSFGLMRLFPSQRILWWSLILIVAAERIAENAHYPSDTVAATALGWVVAEIAWRLTGRPGRRDGVPNVGRADI